MSAAVRSLRDEGTYAGKIRFYIIEIDSKKVREEVARWEGLGDHGIVGTTADGVQKVHIPGHQFGKSAVVQKADELLRLTSPPS